MADEISKVGDTVTYTITVTNTGDVPLTKVSVSDDLLPNVNAAFATTLASGDSESHQFVYTVPGGAPDPLVNEVEAIYEDSTGQAFSDMATATVDLVHPSIEVTKTANPTVGEVGDTITYTITVENTGDVALILDSVEDTLLGSLAGFASTLGVGAFESNDFDRDILSTDLDPLVNTVVFHYHPDGLENDISGQDDATVEIIPEPCGLQIEKRDAYSLEIVNRPGLIVRIEPNPYTGAGSLEVEDNVSAYDTHTDGYGIILLVDINDEQFACDLCYDITEIAAPEGYNLDSSPWYDVCVTSIVTVELFDSPLSDCETAFAYSDDATCFIGMDFDGDGKNDFNRWGWSIGPLSAGNYTFDIWAAAGQCVLSNGTLVGKLYVRYDGSTATWIVEYSMNPGFTMDETHLYVGSDPLPSKNGEFTVAPGQYPFIHDPIDLTIDRYVITDLSGPIYIVAHAVVCGDYND